MGSAPEDTATPGEEPRILNGEDTTAPPANDVPQDDDTPAVSSPASDEPASMYEAASRVLESKSEDEDDTETASGSPADKTEISKDGKPEGETPAQKDTDKKADKEGDDSFLENEVSSEELASYGKSPQKRIKKLLQQRAEARQDEAIVKQAEPIVSFMREQDLAMEDMDIVLNFAAQIRKGDFTGFLESVTPYVNLALQYTGKSLPPDLQKKVDEGYVSPDIAAELSRSRLQSHLDTRKTEQLQQSNQQQQVETQASGIRDAVVDWERRIRQTDPEYDLKADVVRTTAQALMQQYGSPKSPAEALKYVEKAYEDANTQIKRFQPKPKATAPSPTSSGPTGTPERTAPTSMLEAAEQAISN